LVRLPSSLLLLTPLDGLSTLFTVTDKQEGLERLILKTDSTVKKLMSKRKFEASYTGLTLDAAKYIVEHTDIKLIGIDYLSIAAYKDMAETHKVLLDKGIVIVEGLNLEEASEGWHNLVCLPLKLARVEGAPARCILTAAPSEYWTKHRNKAPVDMGDWTPWDFANTDE
jgi:kynurenine formamidase